MESRFAYDTTGIYVEATGFILPTDDLYLLGILNSEVSWEWLKRTCYVLGDPDKKGRVRLKSQWLVRLPIYTIDFSDPDDKARHDKIVKLLNKIIELNNKKRLMPSSSKRERIEREIKKADEEIDHLVYELYGITDDERKIIEASGSQIS